MLQIRHNVFETNSSSTHSISVSLNHSMMMCGKPEYESWKNGNIYLNNSSFSDKKFITKEMAMDIYLQHNESFEQWLKKHNIITYENYKGKDLKLSHHAAKEFEEEFETDSGETVVCFGYCYADGDCEEIWD